MITSTDLDQLGKQVSDKFVSGGVTLNDGLKKVASENGLNREQIQRVAEAANTETYLELIKTSKDNYVNFDLADYKTVHEGLVKAASDPFVIDDYDLDYEEIAGEFGEVVTEPTLEKIASEEKLTENEALRQADEARATVQVLENALSEANASIEKDYTTLEHQAKQAVLEGTPFSDVIGVIKTSAHQIWEPLTEDLKEKMSSYAPHIDLEKEAQGGTPNPKSELYKAADYVQEDFHRYIKIDKAIEHYKEKFHSLNEEYDLSMVKSAGVTRFLYGTTKNLVNFVINNPKTSIGIGAYVTGRKVGKTKGKLQQGEVLRKGMVYKKVKPKILPYSGR